MNPGDLLFQTSQQTRVVLGDDPGRFYCEHAFFVAQAAAAEAGSHVLANGHGERLVAFLHVPRDPASLLPGPSAPGRHAAFREVLDALIAGFVDDGATRVLVTGYGNWRDIQNNPSGDCCASYSSSACALETAVLSVDDAAIDGGSRSLQALMRTFKPHAVIATGVHTNPERFIVEHRCCDGNLRKTDAGYVREEGAVDATRFPSNFAGARALVRASERGARRLL